MGSACTPDCTRPRPGSRLEHCLECHQTFASTRAGDDHRTGEHGVTEGPRRRRCRTPDEMRSLGLWLTDLRGRRVWHGRASTTGDQWRRDTAESWPRGPQDSERAEGGGSVGVT